MECNIDYGTISSTSSSNTTASSNSVVSLSKMDNELHCLVCTRYYQNPIILPCGHSLCLSCAHASLLPAEDNNIQHLIQLLSGQTAPPKEHSSSALSGTSSTGESDRVSVISEADSGVVFVTGNSSRPGSCVGKLPAVLSSSKNHLSYQSITQGLMCPSCRRVVGLFDDKGLSHLPKNTALEKVIKKATNAIKKQDQTKSSPQIVLCQLCEDPGPGKNDSQLPAVAEIWCEQCDAFYCGACRIKCHPSRGPLAKHSVLTAEQGAEVSQKRAQAHQQSLHHACQSHSQLPITAFCHTCRLPVCTECIAVSDSGSMQVGVHFKHDVQPLASTCKAKKSELSQLLQLLSERAKSANDLIHQIKGTLDSISAKHDEAEQELCKQLDLLVLQIEAKKRELRAKLTTDKEHKIHQTKECITRTTSLVTQSTGFIQFSIEMLKETDPVAFLLISQSLIQRAAGIEQVFGDQLFRYKQDSGNSNAYSSIQSADTILNTSNGSKSKTNSVGTSPLKQKPPNESGRTPTVLKNNVSLIQLRRSDLDYAKRCINELRLYEKRYDRSLEKIDSVHSFRSNKLKTRHQRPAFQMEECVCDGNTITLVWNIEHPEKDVDHYTLELDDGANGLFRKVYRGRENMCTVEGLHFRSQYRARVKANFNSSQTEYSEVLKLQTSDFAWFYFDAGGAPSELVVSNGSLSVTSRTAEHRLILASTGMSKGIHYWEFIVERYEAGAQPAFGIAKSDCSKDKMLGRDPNGWAMYIDNKRSWFLHDGAHFERTDGGIQPLSVIGVRLDCDRGSLSYYLNGEPHGPIAFTELPPGVYYPAVSLNNCIQVTLHTGIEPPSESEESDPDDSFTAPAGPIHSAPQSTSICLTHST